MALAELTAPARRLALVGLAKNTGKTVALDALLRELEQRGERVGVTSVGRDGERRDVIDRRIEKPRVRLPTGSVVATTDALLSASAIPHELLEDTHVRTPLGRVHVARLREAGEIELAGPSAAADVRAVSDAMLGHGAERVLIDGAIDRRAASSPAISDGLVVCTGAVLSRELEQVIARSRDALELVRLARPEEERVRKLAGAALDGAGGRGSRRLAGGVLLDGELRSLELDPGFVLTSEPAQIAAALERAGSPRWLFVRGALPEPFLRGLAAALRARAEPLVVVVADATHVFLSERGPGHYARQGVELRALEPISLLAVTVNPLAPRSHSFDSAELRARLCAAVPGVPVFDVRAGDYPAPAP